MTAARLPDVWTKLDEFFDRVQGAHATDMACAPGCHACCQAGLSVTPCEAQAIAELVATFDAPQRAALANAARAASPEACVALNTDGNCQIYAARPLVCRSHGVPIRLRTPGHLPVVTCCEKNFRGRPLDDVPAAHVLDQATLSAIALALNEGDTMRIPLATVLETSALPL